MRLQAQATWAAQVVQGKYMALVRQGPADHREFLQLINAACRGS